jgi:hypothetical protein
VVGFFYREEREGAQRGFMGLGINREEREGARRGIYLWDWGLTARNARVREGGGFLTARNAEGLLGGI